MANITSQDAVFNERRDAGVTYHEKMLTTKPFRSTPPERPQGRKVRKGALMAHVIELRPTASQANYFRKCAGVARFAYNTLVAKWKAGEKYDRKAYQKHCSTLRQSTPFMQEVTARAVYVAADQFHNAVSNFFASCKGQRKGRKAKPPTFKKKGKSPAVFRLGHGTQFSVQDRNLRVQGLRENIRMREYVRFTGTLKSVSIKLRAGRWYASFLVELSEALPTKTISAREPSVGVDLGLKALAVLSTGEVIPNPKPLWGKLRLLKRRQRQQSRKRIKGAKKQSNRYVKVSAQVARLHLNVANARADAHHKLTTNLVRRFDRIVIEDLAVGNMVKNRRLSRAISDAGWATIRHQLSYKCKLAGVELVVADRFFASSQTCSCCGHRLAVKLTLKDRVFKCPVCALELDRDLNAAKNLAGFEPVVAPVTERRKMHVLDLCKSFPQGEAGSLEGVNIKSTLTGGFSVKSLETVADDSD